MPLFLKGETLGIGQAEDRHLFGADFPFLPLARRLDQRAGNSHGRPGVHALKAGMGRRALIHNALHVGKAGTVVQFKEGEALGVAPGADPPADPDPLKGRCGMQNVNDRREGHGRLRKNALQRAVQLFRSFARRNSTTTGNRETEMMP